MQAVIKLFLDSLVQVQDHPAALVALVSLGGFAVSALALCVVFAAIKRG